MVFALLLIRVLPVVYSICFTILLFNLISSAVFGNITVKEFGKRLFLALFWPLTIMSPAGRVQLDNIYRRL